LPRKVARLHFMFLFYLNLARIAENAATIPTLELMAINAILPHSITIFQVSSLSDLKSLTLPSFRPEHHCITIVLSEQSKFPPINPLQSPFLVSGDSSYSLPLSSSLSGNTLFFFSCRGNYSLFSVLAHFL